jgi:hypothetical protein
MKTLQIRQDKTLFLYVPNNRSKMGKIPYRSWVLKSFGAFHFASHKIEKKVWHFLLPAKQIKKLSYPCIRPWSPIGLRDVEAPTKIGSQIAVRLSCQPYAPTGRLLPLGRFRVLIFVRGWIDPRATQRLVGLGRLQNPMTSSEIEPVIFRLVAYTTACPPYCLSTT